MARDPRPARARARRPADRGAGAAGAAPGPAGGQAGAGRAGAGWPRWPGSSGAVDAVLPRAGLDDGPLRTDGPPALAVNLHGRGPRVAPRCCGHPAPARLWSFGPAVHSGRERRARGRPVVPAARPATASRPTRPTWPCARPDRSSPVPGAVLIHPGAAAGSRRWPADRFAAVAARAVGRRAPGRGHRPDRPKRRPWPPRSAAERARRRPTWSGWPRWSPTPRWWSAGTPASPTWPPRTARRRWCCSGRSRRPSGARRTGPHTVLLEGRRPRRPARRPSPTRRCCAVAVDEVLAAAEGSDRVSVPRLRRSDPDRPGYSRRRAGRGWLYLDTDGQRITRPGDGRAGSGRW